MRVLNLFTVVFTLIMFITGFFVYSEVYNGSNTGLIILTGVFFTFIGLFNLILLARGTQKSRIIFRKPSVLSFITSSIIMFNAYLRSMNQAGAGLSFNSDFAFYW